MRKKKRNSFLSIFISTLFTLTLFSNYTNELVYAEDVNYDIDIASYPNDTISVELNGQTHSIPSEYTLYGVRFNYSEFDKAYNATGLSDSRTDIYIGNIVLIKEINENIISIPINSIIPDFANGNNYITNVEININGEIGSNAFYNCVNLSGLQIDDATYIYSGAFHGCKSLTGYIVIPDSVTNLDSCLGNASNIEIGLNTDFIVEDEVIPTIIKRTPTITAFPNGGTLSNRSNNCEITIRNWIADVDYFYTTDGSDPLTSLTKMQMDGTNKINLTAPDTNEATNVTVKVQGKKAGYVTTNMTTTIINYNAIGDTKTIQDAVDAIQTFKSEVFVGTNVTTEADFEYLIKNVINNNNISINIYYFNNDNATTSVEGAIQCDIVLTDNNTDEKYTVNFLSKIPSLSSGSQSSNNLRDTFKSVIYGKYITNNFDETDIDALFNELNTDGNLSYSFVQAFNKTTATMDTTGMIHFGIVFFDKNVANSNSYLYDVNREIPKLSSNAETLQTSAQLKDIFNEAINNINITNDFDENSIGALFDSICTNSNLEYQFIDPFTKVKSTVDNNGSIAFGLKFYDKTISGSSVFLYDVSRVIPYSDLYLDSKTPQTSAQLRDIFDRAINNINITNDFDENSIGALFDSISTNSNLAYQFIDPFIKVKSTVDNNGSIAFGLKFYDKTISGSSVFLYNNNREIPKLSNNSDVTPTPIPIPTPTPTTTTTTTGSAVTVTTTDDLKKSYNLVSDYLDDYKAKESSSKNKVKDKLEDLVTKYNVTISISDWDKDDNYLSFTVTIKDSNDDKRLFNFDEKIRKSSNDDSDSDNNNYNNTNMSNSINNNNNNNSLWSDGGYSNCYDNGKYKGTFIQSNGNGGILNIGMSGLKYAYVYLSDLGKYICINNTNIIQDSLVIIPKGKSTVYYVSILSVDTNMTIKQGWLNDYYINKDGLCTGWLKDNNSWYYLDLTDKAKTKGWKLLNNVWYLFDNNGVMLTGWRQDNNTWYYLNSDGSMAHDTNIDGYRLNSNGKLI